MSAYNLGRIGRAHYAHDPASTHAEGVIVSYTDAPTYLLRRTDGLLFSWRADLTETIQDAPPTREDSIAEMLATAWEQGHRSCACDRPGTTPCRNPFLEAA